MASGMESVEMPCHQMDLSGTVELFNTPKLDCEPSLLRKTGYWCFNCYHFIDIADVFASKKHEDYLNKKLNTFESPRTEHSVCICLDCVYYRTQKCLLCGSGSPLCLFPLSEWFDSMPMQRTCIDCTAIEETKTILSHLENLCPSQCILQCNKCCKFKYICSFSVFTQALGNKANRVVRDLDMQQDEKLYKLIVCLECRLYEDIADYRKVLKERYFLKISNEPLLGPSSMITPNLDQGDKYFGDQTYADVVTGFPTVENQYKVDIDSVIEKQLPEERFNTEIGPVYFLSTMKDYICEILLRVLQDEILLLRTKTILELKLCKLPANIWDDIVQKKMQFTTHMFSLQSSGLSNFQDPESRWAYTAVYTPVHASMVFDMVNDGKLNFLLNVIAEACSSQEDLNVCCLGCGPGSEVLGLNPFLPSNTTYHLLDNCAFWSHNAKSLLRNGLGVDYKFYHFDIQKKLKADHLNVMQKSRIFTMVKFISAIQDQANSRKCFQAIFDAAPSGSCFLILDNSQPQIKYYVESLIFPNLQFTQHANYKESDHYRMYTSYAEYRFDLTELMDGHEEICKLLSLVMEWVERPPLVDIRIYVFLIQKK